MMKTVLNKKGETLVEIVITMFILVMATGAITLLVNTSLQASGMSEQKLQATYLAKEGVEAVTNIVATNWLRFPANKDLCWNILDENVNNQSECAANQIQADTSYVLDWAGPGTTELSVSRPYFKWKLVPGGTNFDFENNKANAEQAFCMKPVENISGREGVLHQDPIAPMGGCRFYRELKITYPSSGTMHVAATVLWFHQGKQKQVLITTDLYNNVY